MTTENKSTWWIKYSEYRMEKGEDGTLFVSPAPQAVALAYDVRAKLGQNIEDLVAIAHAPEEERVLRFVRRFGLLGAAMEKGLDQPEETAARAADSLKLAFACTGRPAQYGEVFAPDYREKEANISAWLDWITVLFKRSKGSRQLEAEPFVNLTLQTMLETAYQSMLAERTLHVCSVCKKVYYNMEIDSLTCSEECQRRFKDLEHYRWLKENFHGHLVAGG